ncbi:Bug family tripartite tricarboxylate transporter substrate binding protein [Falsiroseomonas oryzae]|uniref:Bug family tripartite tricarboxylate transporter substrate binding protein n=1 Tax=Falsiroseomonas oryzae TaxID=2766473 RepID=UPI0022EAEBFE|nr:tripartite tricarboxylate transporter substrate binding protein [Roseomonas sp. MO-31]
MPRTGRRALLAALAGGTPAAPRVLAQGAAAEFPSRPIRMIVPYAPGGTSDTMARLVAPPMQAALGQTVLVENRPGAGSLLGTEMVVRAPADGHTLLLADTPLTTVASMHVAAGRPAPYDPVRDLAPVTQLGTAPAVLFASPTLPVRDVQGFFARARERPDSMSVASSGVGSTTHLMAELFIAQSGARMAHVPYRGGGPALQDVAAGNVQATFLAWASGAALVQGGQVRALGVAAAARLPDLPDVPTLREQGLDLVASFWWGLVGPPGLPVTVRDRLLQVATRAMDTPDVTARMAALGVQRETGGPEAFRAHIARESERWGGVIRAAGIRAE